METDLGLELDVICSFRRRFESFSGYRPTNYECFSDAAYEDSFRDFLLEYSIYNKAANRVLENLTNRKFSQYL